MQVNFVEQSLPFDEICAVIEEFGADAQPMIYCGSVDISTADGLADNLALAMGGAIAERFVDGVASPPAQ